MNALAASSAVWSALAILGSWAVFMCASASRAERRVSDGVTPRAPYALALVVAVGAVLLRPPAEGLALGIVCIALVAAAPADRRTGLIFDAVTLPTAIVVVGLSALLGRLDLAALGVATVAGFFFLLVTVSRGRWMGLGDVKAIYAIAAAFGPIESVLAIFIACLSGIAVAVARPGTPAARALPFGPHLALGACTTLACGPFVEHVWMHI